MNSRQRRGVILLILSVLCALAAFGGVLVVVGDVNSKVGNEVAAYRVKGDIAPYTPWRPASSSRSRSRSDGCPRPPSPTWPYSRTSWRSPP